MRSRWLGCRIASKRARRREAVATRGKAEPLAGCSPSIARLRSGLSPGADLERGCGDSQFLSFRQCHTLPIPKRAQVGELLAPHPRHASASRQNACHRAGAREPFLRARPHTRGCACAFMCVRVRVNAQCACVCAHVHICTQPCMRWQRTVRLIARDQRDGRSP